VRIASRFPYLRVLEVNNFWIPSPSPVHSRTIEELLVAGGSRLRIVAPMLRKFTLGTSLSVDFSMSLLAPKVENLSYNVSSPPHNRPLAVRIGIGEIEMWYLNHLKLGTEKNGFVLRLDLEKTVCLHYFSILLLFLRRKSLEICELFYCYYELSRGVLHLTYDFSCIYSFFVTQMRNLQEMLHLRDISVLELNVETCGHVYGATAVNLLRICNAIQRLKLVITKVI
jgi:hypothetical protein